MVTPANATQAKAQPNANAAESTFRYGTQQTVKSTGFSQTVTLGSSTQPLQQYQIAPTNILRVIFIEVTGTTSGNSASVAFNADAPMNVLSTINFADAGGNSIVGSFDGYTLAMAMKYFGYSQTGDPRNNAKYSAVTGTGATGGSFFFTLRIPVEAVARTGVDALPNQTTQSPFTLDVTVNTESAVYSTNPTSAPTVTVKYTLGGYWNGQGALQPTPQAYGSTQYISRSSIPGLDGASQFQLPNNGLGNPIRNIAFLNYTSSARDDSSWPDPLQVTFRGNNLVQYSQSLWKTEMSQWYGLTNTTIDTGSGLDTGVYVLPFTRDFGLVPGAELGLSYLRTNVGDEIELIGTWGSSSTLYELVNFTAVKGAPNLAVGIA